MLRYGRKAVGQHCSGEFLETPKCSLTNRGDAVVHHDCGDLVYIFFPGTVIVIIELVRHSTGTADGQRSVRVSPNNILLIAFLTTVAADHSAAGASTVGEGVAFGEGISAGRTGIAVCAVGIDGVASCIGAVTAHFAVACAAMLALSLFGAGGGAATMCFIIHFHITTLVAGLLMGAVAVVGVGVGCTITMRLRVLGDGIMDVLHPVITQLGGNRVVPELFPGYTCDLYVITPGFQIRIAVYSLKTVITEVIAILDCINTPKRAKCRKLCLVGQVCTALKTTCKQAVFKGSLCTRIGEAQESAHINGWGVIIAVLCVIGLDGAVGSAVADGHFTGILLNLADKAARAGVHTVLACIKGAVPGALFDQALVVCVSHKAADHADAVGLRGNIHEGGDILNDRAVALKVVFSVQTANRADDTANVIDLGVHDHIAENGKVLNRTGSDLTEEANAVFGTFHVQTPDGVVLSVKDTAEIVVLLAGLADGCPGLVFKVDIRCQNALDLSVALYVDLLCKPEELACVVNLIVALCV